MKLIFVIWMFSYSNPFHEEHAWKNWRVSLFMLLPTCASCVILMLMTYACPSTVALHPRRSCTPKIFHLMTQTMILALQSVSFGREEVMILSLSLSLGGRQLSPKVIRKPKPKKEYLLGCLLGISDLSPLRLGSLNLD